MEASASDVKEGASLEGEDMLLRKCIEKQGEGKWCEVPPRAGLNGCRRSSRLRWLNNQPNAKWEEFTTDEVDLIIRMHKLLGNRWSLIAGRLPGRTGKDIKNFCNIHLKETVMFPRDNRRHEKEVMKFTSATDDHHQIILETAAAKDIEYHHHQQIDCSGKVFRPLPRTFCRISQKWFVKGGE